MPEYRFSPTYIFLYKDRIKDLPMYGKMWVRENPYSGIVYVVQNNIFDFEQVFSKMGKKTRVEGRCTREINK